MDKILENHCFSAYETTATDTSVKCRARLIPMDKNDTSLTVATVWATKFIHKALTRCAEQTDWVFTAAKPLLLKEGDLVYTWEFCLSGDVAAGLQALREIDRAPLESKSIEVGTSTAPLGPPTQTKRNVTIRSSQG
jgi:hypothetical protein